MDISRLSRIVTISGIALYTVDLILTAILYTTLIFDDDLATWFGDNYALQGAIVGVPLISALLDLLILGIIIMSLKYAEYYGIGKSILSVIVYIFLIDLIHSITKEFPLVDPDQFMMIVLIVLSALEIVVLYYYAKVQKELFK